MRLGLEAADTSVEAEGFTDLSLPGRGREAAEETIDLRFTDGHGNVMIVTGPVESVLMLVDRVNDRVARWRS